MADFASAGSANRFDFACSGWRKIVMEHIAFKGFPQQIIDFLFIILVPSVVTTNAWV
jgi:hypothetical protein